MRQLEALLNKAALGVPLVGSLRRPADAINMRWELARRPRERTLGCSGHSLLELELQQFVPHQPQPPRLGLAPDTHGFEFLGGAP